MRKIHYVTEEELDALWKFPWRAMVCGLFFGLAFGAMAVGLVLVLA